jgi:putative toxin-antitoxin system antitoxin component (TIGR02293 family)
VARVLGGRQVLGLNVANDGQLILLTRAGLPTRALSAVGTGLGFAGNQVASLVGASTASVSRWLSHPQGRLSLEISDRLLRLARILALAEDTLGTAAKAAHWITTPNRALGDDTPLSLLDTDLGAREVEATLGRLASGVHG